MDLKQFIKESGNEYASIVEEGVAAGDVLNYIDTGSYLFNGLLSGSLHGGLPSNKITALAGESATGKTYFALGMVKQFLDANPDAELPETDVMGLEGAPDQINTDIGAPPLPGAGIGEPVIDDGTGI